MIDAVSKLIEHQGWARLPAMSEDAFLRLAREFGDLLDDTLVRLMPGRRTYLTSPGAIPFHTDHSMADAIAWRCEHQDHLDGALLLTDGHEVIRTVDAGVRRLLARTCLPAMVRLGDEPLPTAVLSDTGNQPAIFYAPWLTPMATDPHQLEALGNFGRAIERFEPITHRLLPGEVLIVDNHRMLHGRGPLLADSPRRLRRLWLRLRQRIQRPIAGKNADRSNSYLLTHERDYDTVCLERSLS